MPELKPDIGLTVWNGKAACIGKGQRGGIELESRSRPHEDQFEEAQCDLLLWVVEIQAARHARAGIENQAEQAHGSSLVQVEKLGDGPLHA